MAMSSDEELRLKCLEFALYGNPRGVLTRARTYYRFAKGDIKPPSQQEQIPMNVTAEGEAKRIAPMVRPN
jgi:hypothetical protein